MCISDRPYEIDEGGGAFYGPKIDLKIKDAIGREWQTSTIQFDFNLPERFDLKYIGSDGQAHQPYMVHRALFGSLERFFGILTEHYAGGFPVWLSPEQIRIIPVGENHMEYAIDVENELKSFDLRVKTDVRSGKLNGKIKNAQLEKIPFMIIIGEKEVSEKNISVRHRLEGNQGTTTVSDFVKKIKKIENEILNNSMEVSN